MRPIRESGRRGWWLAAAGAVGATAVVLALFRAPGAPPPSSGPAAAGGGAAAAPVSIARLDDLQADPLLKEEATLRDPTPLFLPTRWNASESTQATNPRREFAGSFQGYEPYMTFPEAELNLVLPAVTRVPAQPADAFAAEKPSQPYSGLGQTDWQATPLAARGAFIAVVAADSGRPVALTAPEPEAHPPGDASWQPLEFLVAVDPQGIVGPPVLTASSGAAAVDGYFANYLVSILRIGERVGPGFYRISIGP
jgi:hypothetical protein